MRIDNSTVQHYIVAATNTNTLSVAHHTTLPVNTPLSAAAEFYVNAVFSTYAFSYASHRAYTHK